MIHSRIQFNPTLITIQRTVKTGKWCVDHGTHENELQRSQNIFYHDNNSNLLHDNVSRVSAPQKKGSGKDAHLRLDNVNCLRQSRRPMRSCEWREEIVALSRFVKR